MAVVLICRTASSSRSSCKVLGYSLAERLQVKAYVSHALKFDQFKTSEQILASWKSRSFEFSAGDHAAAVHRLGRLVRGRFSGNTVEHLKKHDGMQRSLQENLTFMELLESLQSACSSLTPNQVSATMIGLGDIHEDLAFIFHSKPKSYQSTFISLVELLCRQRTSQLASPSRINTQAITNMLFALSNLNIYIKHVFQASVSVVCQRIVTTSADIHIVNYQQLLFACHNVQHHIADHEEEHIVLWNLPASSELSFKYWAGLIPACMILKSPSRLLTKLFHIMNTSSYEDIKSLSAGAVYGLHVVNILTCKVSGLTSVKLSPEHAKVVQMQVSKKCRSINRTSLFEMAFQKALKEIGVEFKWNQQVHHGFSVDYMCKFKQHVFALEINGPSHFLTIPREQPRGKTTLKRQLFNAMGLNLVDIPYWVVSPPQQYVPKSISGEIPKYNIDASVVEKFIVDSLAV